MSTRSPSVTKILTTFSIIIILALPVLSVRPVFAASILEDGFESGNLSKWISTGGTPTVTSGNAHHGTYKVVLDAASEYIQARFTGIDHGFMRAYVMFKTFPATGNEVTILGIWSYSPSRYMTEARVGNFAGTVKWRMRYYDNGAYYFANSEQQKPSLNTWYCVEVEAKSNTTTNAESRVYINGAELTDITQTGKNNNLQINSGYLWTNAAATHWCDCVVIDTAYVGPEQSYLTVVSPYGTTGGQGWYDYGSTAHATLDTAEVNHDNGTRRTFANWSGDATGTDYTSSDPVTMTSNKTATALWETQHNVTFTQTGLDASASGTVVTVNGVPIDYAHLPYSVWINNGDTVTYSYSNASSTTGGHRFTLSSVSGETSPITVASPILVQGDYVTQYQVVFDQTGIGSDFTGTIGTIDGANYGYMALPAEFWWDDSSLHTFSFSSPLVVNASRQYNWASSSGLSTLQGDTLTINGAGSVTGNYGTKTRYSITFGTSSSRGLWTFEEGAGTVAHDSSGYGNDGTLYGGVTWVDGIFGKALSFDGTSGYVEVPDSDSLDITAKLTLETWIYPKSLTDRQVIICKYNHSSLSSSYYLGVGGTLGTATYMNKIYYALTYDGNHYYAMVSTTNLTVNTWTHVVAVCNTTHMSIYINGVLDAMRTYPPGLIYSGTADLRIGCYLPEAGVGRFFNGTIDEARVEERSTRDDFLGTVATIDDIDYTMSQLPISFWWDEGSSHTFSFQSPLIVAANSKQYVWISTIGLSTLQSGTITVLASGDINANYKTQYYLEVASAYDSPTPTSGWFEAGTNIVASVTSPLSISIDSRYVCAGWTGTGDVPASGTGLSVSFTMTQGSSIAWNWKTQYLLTVLTNPNGLSPQPTRNPAGEAESSNSWWYDSSASVSLAAQEVDLHTFDYWTVIGVFYGSTTNPATVDMDAPHTAIAYYSSNDATPPEIAILSPENKTYYTTSISLEFTIDETTSWIGYSLDNQANITIHGNTAFVAGEGSHSIILYARDTVGNTGSSNTVHFTVQTGVSDIAVLGVVTSRAVVGQGFSLSINVTVENQGDYAESFNVTLYGNATVIGTRENVILPMGSRTALTFAWSTSGFAKGNYAVSAYAWPVPSETDTADNTFADGTVKVTIPGDVDGDFDVDIMDIVMITGRYMWHIPQWWPGPPALPIDGNCDINGDGIINIQDVVICTSHYAQKWP